MENDDDEEGNKKKPAKDGGAKEARTPDLLNAIQTLYQLSYDPIQKTDAQNTFFPRQVKLSFADFKPRNTRNTRT